MDRIAAAPEELLKGVDKDTFSTIREIAAVVYFTARELHKIKK